MVEKIYLAKPRGYGAGVVMAIKAVEQAAQEMKTSNQGEPGSLPLYRPQRRRGAAVTNVYRSSRDLFLAQRFARHVSPLTTTIYTHPSDQEMFDQIRQLPC